MTAPAKIAAFVALLVVVFAASLWVGNAVGPGPDVAVPHPTGVHPHEGDGQ
ncbi:hypothetical protein [Mycobacterium sp. 236(2023)]|uniref:hypothetical protein n=1 Tax=Mycobacterium sp. 236(2023) TaxID=3038163 RepID=UPI002414F45E|nr:hypothetical protein [Mycobacterium sp. 236(2023)]MDG4666270.1 hypothetical protein [Mycobacterium sp. 236(2023)]